MELDVEIIRAAQGAIAKAVHDELVGYNKPLSKLICKVLDQHSGQLESLINDEVALLIGSPDFRQDLKAALNQKLARVLVERMGGELEARVNKLKSNPETNAKITLAITKIVSDL